MAPVYKYNLNLHYTPPSGVRFYSCTTNYVYTLIFQLTTMHPTARYNIVFSFGCRNVMSLKCFGIKPKKLFHKVCIHCCGKRIINWDQHRGKHLDGILYLTDLSTSVAETATILRGLMGIMYSTTLRNLSLWDISVASKQQLNKEGCNHTGGSALWLNTCTLSKRVTRLTLRTFG